MVETRLGEKYDKTGGKEADRRRAMVKAMVTVSGGTVMIVWPV